MKISRRTFMAAGAFGGAAGLLAACGKDLVGPEITEDEAVEYVKNGYPRLLETAHTPGQEMRIEIGGDYLGTIRFQSAGGNFKYLHPVVTTHDGKTAHLLFGVKSLLPSIRLTDGAGRTLERDGKELEFSISESSLPKPARRALAKQLKAKDFDSWLKLGITVFAIALAAWLGLKVIGFVIAVLAFVAFNAMVIGLVIIAFTIADDAIAFLVNAIEGFTGVDLNFESIRGFFDQVVEKIREFLDAITNLQV